MADSLLGGALGGIGDFFFGGGKYADPNAINPQYGVPEADVRQAGINTLANVSALLLAAGQPMSGQQRAQLLAGVGPALGGMQSDIFKASQARLMTAQQRTAMEEARGLADLTSKIKQNPDEIAKLIGRPVEFVRNSSPTMIRDIMKTQASRDPLQQRLAQLQVGEAEREAQEIAAINRQRQEDPEGLARQIGLPPDRVRSLDARTLRDIAKQASIREATITPEDRRRRELETQKLEQDVARGGYMPGREGQIFRVTPGGLVPMTPPPDYGFGEVETPARPPAGVTVPTPPDAARPVGVPPAAQQAPASETSRFASINPNLDYNRAFGVAGAFNWAAGKVRGVVGSEDKATQEAGKAISEVNTLRNSLISATSAEVAGRNLKSTQQRIQELLPTPAAVFTSPAEAVNKFSSIKSLIESDMQDLLFIGSERSGASPADKTKAGQAYRDLRRNRDNINVVIDSLTKGSALSGEAQSQGRPRSRFSEGQTAINPQTGARVMFRNGRWEPM